jgi:dihydrofolate reductase
MVSIIAATGINRELGRANGLLWRLPADMKHFKTLTTGHAVIMGRKTFESLPYGALPERTNVVITNNQTFKAHGCEVCTSLEEAIAKHTDEDEIFIIGGASIYQQALNFTNKIYLTKVLSTFPDADVFFPKLNNNEWFMTNEEAFPANEKNPFPYIFQTLIKKNFT